MSDEILSAELRSALAEIDIVPPATVARVHSAGYAEDGRTFILMLDTVEGETLIVSATPGARLRCCIA